MSTQDFFAFGMYMPGRKFGENSYKYGFNGKEKDDEVYSATGTSYDYGFRIYNPRLGRFLSVDPLFKSYPWYSSYIFSGNKPINTIDLDGEEEVYIIKWYKNGNLFKTVIKLTYYNSDGKTAKLKVGLNKQDKIQILHKDFETKENVYPTQFINELNDPDDLALLQSLELKSDYILDKTFDPTNPKKVEPNPSYKNAITGVWDQFKIGKNFINQYKLSVTLTFEEGVSQINENEYRSVLEKIILKHIRLGKSREKKLVYFKLLKVLSD